MKLHQKAKVIIFQHLDQIERARDKTSRDMLEVEVDFEAV